jgi:glycosyltransferase involved in cell wall biosynthesis
MKKILFLEQFAAISGGQIVLLQILDSLDRGRYMPFVVLPKKGDLSAELEKRNIQYYVLPIGTYSVGRKGLWDVFKYAFLSLILIPLCVYVIKKNNIDLVYANAPRTYLWGTIAARLAGRPVIWHIHSILSGWELKICCAILKNVNVNRIIAISKAVARPFLERCACPDKKVTIVYNGVDYERFGANEVEARKALDIPADCKVIGYIGQLAQWKGVEDFIRAAECVLEQQPKVIFLIIGEVLYGRRKEREYKEYLVELTNKLGINDHVRFLGKRVDIPELLAAMDILVVPSIKPEPLSLALLEGMAAGKTVVACSHGGPAEIIQDKIDGRLFAPGDHKGLSSVIFELLLDPDSVKRLGQAARHKIEERFTLDHFFKGIFEVIDGIIASAEKYKTTGT